MSTVFALLVGINDYPSSVGKLQGCLNDIDNAHDYLKTSFSDAAVVVLKDQDATRANVVEQFRKHLGRAGRGDVAMLHYCGHGARSTAAPEFHEFDLDDRDEGLVCIDSRNPDMFDLADKELALLVRELAANDPHIAMIFDCCHSGSGTRDLDGAGTAGVRMTSGVFPPRPIETYLEGQFAALRKAGEPLSIPSGRHILLAACDRSQTAKEDLEDHRGIFTTSLYDVLRRSADDLSYADLFVRSRAAVRQYIRNKGKTPQDPQFETVSGFDAYAGFLGRAGRKSRPTYSVYHADDRWTVECGAIQGMPTDPSQTVTLALHPESDLKATAGTARTTRVGAQKSELALDFEGDPAARYMAEITSVPQTPMLVGFEGDEASRRAVGEALAARPDVNVALAEPGTDDGFVLIAEAGNLTLRQRDTGRTVRSVPMSGGPSAWSGPMLAALDHVAQWRRSLTLANARPQLDPGKVDFVFAERLEDGTEHVHAGPNMTLELRRADGVWQDVRGKLKLRNRTGQLLNFALVHFSDDYGVRVVANEQVVSGDDYMTINLGGASGKPEVYFAIDNGRDEAVEQLKLILSTERVDDFLLELQPLTDSRGFGSASDRPDQVKPVTDDWFTKDLRVKIVRRLDQVGPAPLALASGQIRIEAHPSVTASIALSTAMGAVRGAGDELAFAGRLEHAGLSLASLAGTRGDNPNMLEISDISDPAALAEAPIALRIDVPLGEGEALVPLVHDGRHVLLAGETWRGDNGATHVNIDRVPDAPIDRRSIGGALKMYFFKTYLQIDAVNRLRWVDWQPDGSFKQRSDDLAERAAGAVDILLVVHGIIGDTEAMIAGVRAAGLHERFDLVLSYDYENLATPIEATARQLKEALAQIGLKDGDGKKLTILAHSMGGLVSRWLVEREGGDAIVDHLVMCGTPNAGSPLGQVEKARKILTMAATIGVNYLPQICAPALMLLTRSKQITPTLEQMAPGSSFMGELNASTDPTTRYTILAGDIDKYVDPDGKVFEELLVKAGRSAVFDAMFGRGPNDIAVGVTSIFGGDAPALASAARADVACYHLNYFSTGVGRDALRAVEWTT